MPFIRGFSWLIKASLSFIAHAPSPQLRHMFSVMDLLQPRQDHLHDVMTKSPGLFCNGLPGERDVESGRGNSHRVKYCGARVVFLLLFARDFIESCSGGRDATTLSALRSTRGPPRPRQTLLCFMRSAALQRVLKIISHPVPLGGGSVGGAAPTDGNRKYIMPRKGTPKEFCSHLLPL